MKEKYIWFLAGVIVAGYVLPKTGFKLPGA
jgi:hypothetical protein